MRNLIRVAVVLLVAHALYRFAPPYIDYQRFKDAVEETALFARDLTDEEIVDRVMELAARYEIPLDRDAVRITHDAHLTRIDLAYVEQIEWVPTYSRAMPFSISAEGWNAVPAGGVLPGR